MRAVIIQPRFGRGLAVGGGAMIGGDDNGGGVEPAGEGVASIMAANYPKAGGSASGGLAQGESPDKKIAG